MSDKKITDLQLISAVTDTLSVPGDDGLQTYRFTPLQLYTYLRPLFQSGVGEVSNLTIVPSVATSALTVAIKTLAGTNASSTDKARIAFRSATLTSGAYVLREISAALSVVVSSGSTLGQASAQPSRIWVYAIDNAGTVELAVSGKRFRDDELVSTTAEGGAGAADSRTVMYSTTARTSVACKCIGYIDNTQSTAGTWASAGSQVQLMPNYITKRATSQTLTSGTTYVTPVGCTRIRVRAAGGGGGGGGTGATGSGGTGGTGGDTTFGSLTAGGGAGGAGSASSGGGGGGAATGGDLNITGGSGGPRWSIASTPAIGGYGGGCVFGPGGAGGEPNGGTGKSGGGYGAGGGGAGTESATSFDSGVGGGGGGYVEATLANPAATYTYGIGAAGAAGAAGTSGHAGGAGTVGVAFVDEYYD